MKRSIGMQSVFGVLAVLAAATAAPACGQAEEPEVATQTAALDQAAASDNSDANDLLQAHCPHDVPAALNPPADATLAAAFPARGVQIYTCAIPAAGGAPAWTLKAPHALLGKGRDVQAIHFAGPSWEAKDGSLVTATKIASAAAPDATDIPWLLLQAATHTRDGLFASVTMIQRLATENGVAPATGCDDAHVGAETLAPYGADYFFYRAAAAGERIRQCAAK